MKHWQAEKRFKVGDKVGIDPNRQTHTRMYFVSVQFRSGFHALCVGLATSASSVCVVKSTFAKLVHLYSYLHLGLLYLNYVA